MKALLGSIRPAHVPPLGPGLGPDLGTALEEAMRARPTATAFIEADRRRETRRMTLREVRDGARRVGAVLQARGVGAGDRVAIVMGNRAAW
ncbi:MAG: hypothetical protein EA398_15125, partial [Deltaproteobacteria bacterium]